MGLQTAMVGSLTSWNRTIRLLFRKLILVLRLCFPFLRNFNTRQAQSGIAQPAYYNSWKDVSVKRTVGGLHWINDLQSNFSQDAAFQRYMNEHRYDEIVRAYFPTKLSAMEPINLKRTWLNSYWNPKSQMTPQLNIFNKSDILFADMFTNTQNIYKLKRVLPGSQDMTKVKNFFGSTLEAHRKLLLAGQEASKITVVEKLVQQGDLYYCDYQWLRKLEDNKELRKLIGEEKYKNSWTTIRGHNVQAFIQIPYAIFTKLKNPFMEQKTNFLCLGAVFNDSASKTNVSSEEIFTPFYSDEMGRDRWELAKSHMASTDTNDFTIRTHLGILHYASSIYTCAFCNIAKTNKQLSWLKTQFIDIFSNGLLQVDFNANLTLVDHIDPMAQRIFYLRRAQSAEMILRNNSQFNILQFCPSVLGENCYMNDAMKISHAYYAKIKLYIDYIICKNWDSIKQPSKIYVQLLSEMSDDLGKMDALPNEIAEDKTPNTLRKIMTNLAYLWVVIHAQTFSLTSVACPFYYVPSMMRKPLSELKKYKKPLTNQQKMEWLPHSDIIRDNMTLHKVVTFRLPEDSLLSSWDHFSIDQEIWEKFLRQRRSYLYDQDSELIPENHTDFWNDLTIKIQNLNNDRLNGGLYVLHWYLPTQMQISLNV